MTSKLAMALCALALLGAASASAQAPPGATARCTDNSYSFSAHHSGTCSHHGGVAAWLAAPGGSPLEGSASSRSEPPGVSDPGGSAPGAQPPIGHTGGSNPGERPVLLAPRTRIGRCNRGVLPDRTCSPGAYDARVTQKNIASTICVTGYTRRVRNVSAALKDAVFRAYGIVHHAPYSYEVDHIVSLELGGSNAIANLYPEAYAGPNGARAKDKLENRLHAAVCAGQIRLRDAQVAIAGNWLAAYRTYGFRS